MLALAGGLLAGIGVLDSVPHLARGCIYLAAIACVGCFLYGNLVEAKNLQVSRIRLHNAKVAGEPLVIAHLSDLHVRRWGALEDALILETAALEPDLILLSGDYTAMPGAVEDARRLIADLSDIAPVFACRGNSEYRPPPFRKIFEGTGASILLNERRELSIKGTSVSIVGVDPGEEETVFALGRSVPAGRLSICLYHYPDLVPRVGELPFDLMLCGHTHGGQVRIPLVGAVVTMCRAGARYAAGLFSRDGRAAYVSRGVGTESYGLPPVRFLCPPELVMITISR